MDPTYQRLRAAARRIAAALPPPNFYRIFQHYYARSRQFFDTDPTIRRLYRHTLDIVGPSLGHGIGHATAVSVDGGCLVLIAADTSQTPTPPTTLLRLIQTAGLLHDICRSERDHAAAGADAARALLVDYPFTGEETGWICDAIRRHVAFQPMPAPLSAAAECIGDCLYDADKFRWGPDNFTHTVWDMLDAARIPPSAFAERYDSGIRYVETIAATFRTPTGKRYGPEFIDLGLAIARELKPLIDAEIQAPPGA